MIRGMLFCRVFCGYIVLEIEIPITALIDYGSRSVWTDDGYLIEGAW